MIACLQSSSQGLYKRIVPGNPAVVDFLSASSLPAARGQNWLPPRPCDKWCYAKHLFTKKWQLAKEPMNIQTLRRNIP